MWLLDVDGVLNAVQPGWGVRPSHAYARYQGVEYRFRWAPPLIHRIRALAESGDVEIRWSTTWVDAIDEVENAFRLGPFPLAYRRPADSVRSHNALKLQAALDVLDSGRPLVWTDDVAIPTHGPDRDALAAAGTLLIAPDERTGLQPEHWDAIARFVRGREEHGARF